ncbi:unnamed protein product [Rotaria sp. Silwood2]|nr:unnamed protein product [Rotaria sp. Silwood2]CAF3363137.1 unnamed protein product [Rotaria sp. Silwood2]CAF4160189.1 unnamed protein product [Rotaria sp. Silwood2]CAF4263304.1 unnamed protein product [Rotaria sp. Silwood2]
MQENPNSIIQSSLSAWIAESTRGSDILLFSNIYLLFLFEFSLKSSNILTDYADHLKLADFDLAHQYHMVKRALIHEVVTLWYRSPKILLNTHTALDIWSFSCVFAEMIFGEALFRHECETDQLLLIFQ